MKKMVMFTTLFFNKVGNQSLLETVKQYSKHFDIYLITSASESDSYYLSSEEAKRLLPDNVFFFRQSGWFKNIFRSAFSLIKGITNKKNRSEIRIDNNLQNLNYTFLNLISFHVSYFSLFLLAGKLKILKKLPYVDYICAYEIGGVTPAIRYKKAFNRKAKLFSKQQGTILYDAILKGVESSDKNYSLDHHAYSKLKSFDLVCMTNDGTYGDLVLEHYGVDSSKYLHIMNGISESIVDFSREYRYIKNNREVIKLVTVSRLVGWKRVYLGIELLNILVNREGRYNFTLDIYGHGNEDEIHYLKSLIQKYKLQEYVVIKGQVSHHAVASIMGDADFVISLYKMTNVTNPLLEAMYLNVPVITLSDSSLLSIVKNEKSKNRFIFDEIDEIAVLEQISEFLADLDIVSVREIRFKLNGTVSHELMTWEKRIGMEVTKLNSL